MAATFAAALFAGTFTAMPAVADDNNRRIVIRDDCDPDDPAWAPTGGCDLEHGDVTNAEFGVELQSPLAASVIGHQAWRNDPPYLKIREGETVKVRNRGGRTHTFTEVEEFGAGRIGPPFVGLNFGLAPTRPDECPASASNGQDMPPGASRRLAGLAPGNHRFQCCIHPWMRAIVKVKAEEDEDEDDQD